MNFSTSKATIIKQYKKEETKHFIENCCGGSLKDRDDFITELKSHILYHLIVLEYDGDIDEVEKEIEELWNEYGEEEEEEEEEEKKDDESVSSFYLRCCDYCDEEYHYDDLTELGEYDDKFYCKKCVEEIEEKKQNEKKKKEKKPKKKLILVLEEEEEEKKEEKILTASLEEKIKNAGIPTLVSIYGEQFKRRISNMNASSIPLEKRKNLITKKILEKCTTIEIKKTIMDTYFTKKEKKQKDASWINDFVVGEEVLVLNTKPQTKYSRNITRKGLIQKINKTSVSVRLYGYNEIDDDNALKHQTHGYNRLIWWNFTNDSQVIYSKSALVKKGDCEYYDEQFIEGKRSVDYGN
jgi:hypothetical protein